MSDSFSDAPESGDGTAAAGMTSLGIGLFAVASFLADVFVNWRGDHFERVIGTIGLFATGVIVGVVVAIHGIRSNPQGSSGRKWAWVGLAVNLSAPIVALVVLQAVVSGWFGPTA